MSGAAEQRVRELEERIEELRRINDGLRRELVKGAASRQPRSPIAAGRAVARLYDERDLARTELERAQAQLESLQHGFEGLRLEREALRAETARLRSGLLGFLRRARARLLRR